VITEKNIIQVTEDIKHRRINFHSYLDRASDVDDNFLELAKILSKRKTRIFNPYKKIEHAIDKATMHLEFITAGINVPYSIIIPPHSQAQEIFVSVDDLAILGRPFIIKPCNTTGGGIGVVTGAESLKEVLSARLRHSNDKYLVQEKIFPFLIDDRRAWFRCFWAFGKPICVWWDDETHIYNVLQKQDIKQFELRKLFQITKTIAGLTQLDFFSTEIAFTNKEKFVVIDYVNDQCDMRLKSHHSDGVPDETVLQIINNLRLAVAKIKRILV
jgi:glutathione synthase/RimK-type ligase-like ATP-grasp enzyme